MATKLTPNETYMIMGVKINEKIIPDNMRWTNAKNARKCGCSVGQLYKHCQKLPKVEFVTIHNTADLDNVMDDAEQYTRATYNENMNTTRVQFYIDENGAWQNLRAGTGLCKNDPIGSAEVGYHSGDGTSNRTSGNMTSLSMELIMGEGTSSDKKTYDNSARIAAWLLWRHRLSIDRLVTHTYWVNKSAGNIFADVDEQCCNPVKNKKWCPTYIFNSSNKSIAMKNWKAYKALVKSYLDTLNGGKDVPDSKPVTSTTSTVSAANNKKLYRVQIGAFSSKTNAENYATNVKSKGYSDSYIIKGNDNLYRVQIGAFSSKSNAEKYLADAKKKGFNGFVVESKELKSVDEIANEVIAGKWGCGEERKRRLKEAGYDYNAVQARVNQLCK